MSTQVNVFIGTQRKSEQREGYVVAYAKTGQQPMKTNQSSVNVTQPAGGEPEQLSKNLEKVSNDKPVYYDPSTVVASQTILNAVPPKDQEKFTQVTQQIVLQQIDSLQEQISKLNSIMQTRNIDDIGKFIVDQLNDIGDVIDSALAVSDQAIQDMFTHIDTCCFVQLLAFLKTLYELSSKDGINVQQVQGTANSFGGWKITKDTISVFIPTFTDWKRQRPNGTFDEYYTDLQNIIWPLVEFNVSEQIEMIKGYLESADQQVDDAIKPFIDQLTDIEKFLSGLSYTVNGSVNFAKTIEIALNFQQPSNDIITQLGMLFKAITQVLVSRLIQNVYQTFDSFVNVTLTNMVTATLDDYTGNLLQASHAYFAGQFKDVQISMQHKKNYSRILSKLLSQDLILNSGNIYDYQKLYARYVQEQEELAQDVQNQYFMVIQAAAVFDKRYSDSKKVQNLLRDSIEKFIQTADRFGDKIINTYEEGGDVISEFISQILHDILEFATDEKTRSAFITQWNIATQTIADIYDDMTSGNAADAVTVIVKFIQNVMPALIGSANVIVIDAIIRLTLMLISQYYIGFVKYMSPTELIVKSSVLKLFEKSVSGVPKDQPLDKAATAQQYRQLQYVFDKYASSVSTITTNIHKFKCGMPYVFIFELLTALDLSNYIFPIRQFVGNMVYSLSKLMFGFVLSQLKDKRYVTKSSVQTFKFEAVISQFKRWFISIKDWKTLDPRWIDTHFKTCLDYIKTGNVNKSGKQVMFGPAIISDMFNVNSALADLSIYRILAKIAKVDINTNELDTIVRKILETRK